jgi:type IV pilus assembly protein PilB
MPITEEIQRIILRDGSALEIAEQARPKACAPARIRPAQGQAGRDLAEEVLAVTNE